MYTSNREAYRQTFFKVWDKHRKQLPLDPIEIQLLEIILMHPEYHVFLNKPTMYQAQEFSLEENPFFHMSLHLAIRDQIQMDRPTGVKCIYDRLIKKVEDEHEATHLMMTSLAKILWSAQQSGESPTDEAYLQLLNEL